MIWILDQINADFIDAFVSAGEPDQGVIDAFVSVQPRRLQHQQKRPDVKRWYYLLQENPRISLATLAFPLNEWQGAAFFLVGTREIIGEFPGNRDVSGRKGLQLKMQPLAWTHGQVDRVFSSGSELLASISEQILDLETIERVQQETRQKYQW